MATTALGIHTIISLIINIMAESEDTERPMATVRRTDTMVLEIFTEIKYNQRNVGFETLERLTVLA